MLYSEELLQYFENRLPEHYNSDAIRTTQVQMALDIFDFLQPSNKYKFFIIEAPVGTGKSLGALIPVTLYNQKKNKRLVYATSTVNLQGQLMREEIPLLKEFGLIKNPILAKGKTHYYCHMEFKKKEHLYKKYASLLESFFSQTKTGHRDEFEQSFSPISNKEWEGISFTGTKGDCKFCDWQFICPTFNHRDRFLSYSNDVVVTNHDQLIRSVLLKYGDSWQQPIVPVDSGVVVIDEGHDTMDNFLGQSESSIRINDIKGIKGKLPYNYRKRFSQEISCMERILKAESEIAESLQGRYPISKDIIAPLKKIGDIIDDAITVLVSRQRYSTREDSNNSDGSEQLESVLNAIRTYYNDDYVSWVSFEDNSFTSASRRFPGEFKKFLDNLSRHNKVIIMSGTLTAVGDFEKLIKQWRLNPKDVMTTSLPTTFSYDQQSLMYVPDDLVNIKDDKGDLYISNQVQHIKSLIEITDGRSLILTTSKKMLTSLYDNLEAFTSDKGIKLLKQESGGVEILTDTFKKDERSVLIGSGSFFSGFSVPGKALISVIINKLPFPVPNDPYLQLISEGIDDDMFDFIIFPSMMIKLNQAVGRLIRDIKDYGVISVLDPRIFSEEYGKVVQASFMKLGYTFTRNVDNVKTFYSNIEQITGNIKYSEYSREQLVIHKSLLVDPDIIKEFPFKRYHPINFGTDNNDSVYIDNSKISKTKSDITSEQWKFYEDIRLMKNLPKERMKKLKTSRDLYEYLYNLFYQIRGDVSIVSIGFPYVNNSQKDSFMRFKGSGVVTYKLSKEELKRYN